MTNNLRRMMALIVALALCVGQIAVPAMAAEQETTVHVTVTPIENGIVVESATASDAGTVTETTKTITETTKEVPGGTVTTKTESVSETTTDTATGDVTGTLESEKKEVQTDLTVDKGSDGTDTVDRKEWESTTTETDIQPETGENPTTQVTTETVTTVTGSETQVENKDVDGDVETTTGSLHGKEDTETVTTTTTTTTTGDVLLTEEDITDEPIVETTPTEQETINKTEENDGWEFGEETDNAWDSQEDLTEGTETTPISEEETTTLIIEEWEESVTLTMEPNGETVTEEIALTLEHVSDGVYTDPATGNQYTVEKVYEGDKCVGWKVTNQSTEETQYWKTGDPVDPETEEEAQWTETGSETKVIEPENYTEGTEQLDENTTRTTKKVTDPETGEFLYYEVTTVTDTTTVTDSTYDSQRETITTGELVKPEGSTTTGENGETIVTTVEDLMENGQLVGYTTTTVTTDSDGNHLSTVTDNVYAAPPVEDTFTLPEKPQGGVRVTEDGKVIATFVENILENGTHVGYKTTTVTTVDGVVTYTESRSIYGTSASTSTVTVMDPQTEQKVTTTNTVVTTVERVYATETNRDMDLEQEKTDYYNTTITTVTDEYILENTADGKLYFTYQGVMYEVKGTSTIVEDFDVATNSTVSMDGLTLADDMRTKKDFGNVNDHYSGYLDSDAEDSNQNGVWTHVGYGQYSGFVLKDSKGGAHTAKHFAIKDGDTIRYVYCVELGTGIETGTYYDPNEYTGTPGEATTPPWTGAEGNIAQLRSVALNGYWGTDSGLGSLQAVKDLMIRNGYEDEAANLTEGMAMAATQAAIWEYGAPAGVDFTGDYITYDDSIGSAPTEADANTIKTLRNLLIRLANDGTGAGVAQAITPDKFIAGSTITVHNRMEDADGNAKTDNSGNTLYNTDLSFQMAVSTSSINGDLILSITNERGDDLGQYRLAGENGENEDYDTIYPDPATGVYTIKNLVLAENVEVTLNLDGVQHLDDGIYVYEGANEMQDFIGLSMKKNKVDLSVSLEFSVEDPAISHTHTVKKDNRVDTRVHTKYDTRTDTKVTTLIQTDSTTVTKNSHNIKVYGTVTATETKVEETKEHRHWHSHWQYLTDLSETDGGGGNGQTQEGTLRSDAPKTGDISDVLTAISMLSLAGVILLRRKRD